MAYRDVILADSPWAYWRGAITTGQVLDETGANRHMNVQGGVTTAASMLSVPGTSLVFPGTTGAYLDYSGAPGAIGTGYPRSVEFWITVADGDNPNGCAFSVGVGLGNGRGFDVNTVRRLALASITALNGEGIRLDDGALHHVWVMSNDAAPTTETVQIYVDGYLAYTTNLVYGIANVLDKMAIGVRLGTTTPTPTPGTYLQGKLQEIAYYQNAPNRTTVYRHFCAGTDKGEAPAIVSATWLGSSQLLVRFNKPMFATASTANFTVSGGATVTAAVPTEDFRRVLLTVTGVPANASRTVTMSANVKDALAVALATASTSFVARTSGAAPSIDAVLTSSSAIRSTAGVASIFVSPDNSSLDNGVRYHMRAFRTDTKKFVSWAATAPDFTATQSGVNPSVLEDIVFVSMTGVLVEEEE